MTINTQFTRGVRFFFISCLAAASGATLAASSPSGGSPPKLWLKWEAEHSHIAVQVVVDSPLRQAG